MQDIAEALFRRGYSPGEFTKFRNDNEACFDGMPIETASIGFDDTDPALREIALAAPPGKAALVDEFLDQLGLFLHGPFPLPGNRVTKSLWDCRGKRGAYEACGLPSILEGARVLDVGCNAGYDSFLMKSFGALEVVGLEPYGFYQHAMFLQAVYGLPGVRFMNLGWEELDSRHFQDFDVVNCQGLLYHVKSPILLLERLASIMREGASLVLETHVLSEPSMQAQFIETSFWSDPTYWWIFGDGCIQAMLRACGFREVRMPLKLDCDSRNPADPRTTVEGHPPGARAWLIAVR
jgi:tRNA (mo5U34)-methyltransferase